MQIWETPKEIPPAMPPSYMTPVDRRSMNRSIPRPVRSNRTCGDEFEYCSARCLEVFPIIRFG
jgi:hypothetical protein